LTQSRHCRSSLSRYFTATTAVVMTVVAVKPRFTGLPLLVADNGNTKGARRRMRR
jgi:hypothetical protein